MSRRYSIEQTSEPAPPGFNPIEAAIVAFVAPGSPAEQLGLSKDDRLISIDGQPFLHQEKLDITVRDSSIHYRFYVRSTATILDVRIDPVPLGILAEPASASLVKDVIDNDFSNFEAYHLLWKRSDWELLLQAANAVYPNGPIGKTIRKVFKTFGRHATMLYTGAALYELGNCEEGIDRIVDFMNSVMRTCDTHEHAVAHFYLAKWYELHGNTAQSQEYYRAADHYNGGYFERISREIYLQGLQPQPERYRRKGETFPALYELDRLEGGPAMVSLAAALQSLGPAQLQPVCVMPSYRDNGPYNTAMGCYLSMYPFICDHVAPLHIVLDELVTKPGNEWRLENEKRCKAHGIPFVLLHDPTRSVSESLEMAFSPIFYFLDREGVIQHEGSVKTSAEAWPVYARLKRQAV